MGQTDADAVVESGAAASGIRLPVGISSRQLTAADTPAVTRLEAAWFTGEAWSEVGVHAELSDPYRCYLGLFADAEEMIGYGGISLYPEADLMTIAVAPKFRGRGLGKFLLSELLNAAIQARSHVVFLEVRAGNKRAQELYLKAGFQELGIRKNYYRHPREDAVVMRLTLPRTQLCKPGVS